MKRRGTRILAMVLALLLAIAVGAPIVSLLAEAESTDDTVQEYEKKEKSAWQELQELEGELNRYGEEIRRLEEENEEADRVLSDSEQELAAAEEIETEQKEAFAARFSASCEGGSLRYLETLFSAESLSDFLEKIVIVREIAEYDRNILRSMERIKTQIQEEKTRQETLKSERAQRATELEQATEELMQKSAEIAAYRQSLEEDKQAYLQYLEEQQAAERATKARAGIEATDGNADLSKVSESGLLWPANTTRITSEFSLSRVNPVSGTLRPHTGTDIGASQGTPVWAAQTGTVVLAEANGGYGNCIIVDHGNGVRTLYGHLSAILVQKGQSVVQGEQIGRVGSTGNSTGPHLHFEVLIDGVAVDPMNFFER